MAAPIIAAGVGAAGSALGGWMANQGNKETKVQKRQRKTVDDLIASLYGQGPYSQLFNMDEDAFQKSYVDPAMALFQNQIAPQIQQQYINSGLQRGSGMEAQLTRAGVDLEQMLNQQYYQMQQDAMNRQMSALQNILGMGPGAPAQQSGGQAAAQGAAGFFSSPAFGQAAQAFGDWAATPSNNNNSGYQNQQQPQTGGYTRKGYANDNSFWS